MRHIFSSILKVLLYSSGYQNLGKSLSTIEGLKMASIEETKKKFLSMSVEEKRKFYACGENYTPIGGIPKWSEYARIKHLTGSNVTDGDFNYRHDLNEKVSLFVGDLTKLEIDCVVNAANKRLAGGGGVDGAIHRAAGGDMLQRECQSLNGCQIGESKITSGYRLPAKYVIHTVGPVGEKPLLLESCYKISLDLMETHQIKTIAFPCISTGIYGYPNECAAHVAIATVRKWMESNEYTKSVDRIIFCLFMNVDIDAYHKLMSEYFPVH